MQVIGKHNCIQNIQQQLSESFVASINCLKGLASSGAGAKEKIQSKLGSILDAVSAQKQQIDQVSGDIGAFSDKEEENIRNFHSDAEKAKAEIIGDQKEVKSFQDEIQCSKLRESTF